MKVHESFTELQNEDLKDYFFKKYLKNRSLPTIIYPANRLLGWKWYEEPKKRKRDYRKLILKWLGWV